MRGEADADKVVRFKQSCAVVGCEALAVESFVEYGLDVRFHLMFFLCVFAGTFLRFPQSRKGAKKSRFAI